jgi:uncharacterized protein
MHGLTIESTPVPMTTSPFEINVADLLGRDAPARDVLIEVPVDWSLELSAIQPDPTLTADLALSALPGAILAMGSLYFRVEHTCRRCLTSFLEDTKKQVTGLFEAQPDEESYRIDGDEIDLEPFLRDEALLSLPLLPECPDGCTVVVTTPETDLNTDPPGESPFAVLRDLLPPGD